MVENRGFREKMGGGVWWKNGGFWWKNGVFVGFWPINREKVGKSREFDDFLKIGKNREK